MKRIGIFGTSGMARETGDVAWDLGYEPIFVAKDESELETWSFPAEAILEADVLRYKDIPFAIGIGDGLIRKVIAQRYFSNLKFINLIHTTASFGYGQKASIDETLGLIICAGVRLTNNIKIGSFTIVNQNVTIAHDVVLGEFVHIASGCSVAGNVEIGDNCWIGSGSTIVQGSSLCKLQIGSHTIIGSGAVVLRSCEPRAVYVGVPAKRIK
jgi:sugar O-acyltransferase (sialic acid O-acetyltransferase NeuD family)